MSDFFSMDSIVLGDTKFQEFDKFRLLPTEILLHFTCIYLQFVTMRNINSVKFSLYKWMVVTILSNFNKIKNILILKI